MKIKQIKVKSILTKTNLPAGDFVINPYVGCQHACCYCYARFMKRFTNHQEPWGSFVDIKINAPQVLEKQLRKFKKSRRRYNLLLSSVTDPYQPLETKYKITQKILKILSAYPCFDIEILTKSDLILRDLNLIKKLKNLVIIFSIGVADDKIAKYIEPNVTFPSKRITALKKLHQAGIKTSVFISPILPKLTNLTNIFEKVADYTDEILAETFNPKGKNYSSLAKVLNARFPHLISEYQEIFLGSKYQAYLKTSKKEFYFLANKYHLSVYGFFTH